MRREGRDPGELLLDAWLRVSATLWNERLVTEMPFHEAMICNLLSRKAEEEPGSYYTATALCDRTKLLKSQMNRVLGSMEAKGYIRRFRSEEDRRQLFLVLEETGFEAYRGEHARVRVLLEQLVDKLGVAEALQAAESLHKIAWAAEEILESGDGWMEPDRKETQE